jgi:hypothetical protein
MNKYIFDDVIYEDFDIFNNIKTEYKINNENEYNINTENILNKIYLLKVDINKKKKLIQNINIKISSIKNTFINGTHKWSLSDSCNKKEIKKKVKYILEIHNIISQLKYDKEDIEEIIKNNINNINIYIKNLNNTNNNINNNTNNNTNDDYEDYDELNLIINC